MTRLIDKDYLIEEIRCSPVGQLLIRKHNLDGMIEKFPEVDAEPVRHGKWKQWDIYGFEDTYKCTACGESFVLIEGTPITNGYKYCPSCGAKMGEEDGTDK